MKRFFSIVIVVMMCIVPLHTVGAAQNFSVLREPVYNMADSFYSNITKISKNSAWAICDTNGYPLTSYKWEAMGEIVDEYIPAKQNGQWGYVSATGKVLIPYQFQKADNFSDGIARVLTPEGKYAYINRGGVIVFVSPFDYSFSSMDGAVCGVSNGLYGYCDTAGSIIIHPQFDMAFDFHEGLAAVKFGDKWGYIATNGNYVVKPTYTHASDFKNGYAVCSLSSGWGIIDHSGKKTSSFTFDYIGDCDSAGRFPAKSGNKSGYINSSGKWLMQFDYDFCYGFTDGVARVTKDGLWGYINEQGKELVAPVFVDCGEYRNGRAFYSEDGILYGFLTLNVQGNPAPSLPEPVVTPVTPTEPVTPVKPVIPAEPVPVTPQPPEEDGAIIIDLSQVDNLPALPYDNNCISMKISNPYARKLLDVKQMSASPALVDGVTMVPLRDVVEYMGGTVTWDERSQRINITCKRNRVSITIGSKISYVNGVASALTAAPKLIDGVTMIPVRAVATALGCKIEWVGETQNIYIYY